MASMIVAILWYAASVSVIVATLCSAMPGTAWQFRVCDFPRAQVLVVGLALLAADIAWHALFPAERSVAHVLLLAVLVGSVLQQAQWALRLTALWPAELRADTDAPPPPLHRPPQEYFRIVTANVDYENVNRTSACARLLRSRPDILAVVENDSDWNIPLGRMSERLPYRVIEPRADGCGVALLTRLPIIESSIEHLVSDKRPSIWAKLDAADRGIIRIVVLHPVPPGLPRKREGRHDSTRRDIELHVAAERIRASGYTTWIVTGDFNDVGWSRTTSRFKLISGLRDPRVGRGAYSTFPANRPLLHYPIDHVMLSDDFIVRRIGRMGNIGSDHLPLLAEIGLPGSEW